MIRCDKIAELAIKGDRFAVEYLIAYYDDYINSLCYITIRDLDGRINTYLDGTMKADLQAIIVHLLQTFDYDKAVLSMQEVTSDDP